MIYFRNVNGKLVSSINYVRIKETFTAVDKLPLIVEYAAADGEELRHCFRILDRSTSRALFIFVGDDARTIYLNWNNI